jgi:hypothetical protein
MLPRDRLTLRGGEPAKLWGYDQHCRSRPAAHWQFQC